MSNKLIIALNFGLFAIGWVVVSRLGTDQELPAGFWKIIALILVLDILQCLFLKLVYLRHPRFLLALVVFTPEMLVLGLVVRRFSFDWTWELVGGLVGGGRQRHLLPAEPPAHAPVTLTPPAGRWG
jgi:membrane protease YdiL (CAAX protease family)